MPTKVPTLMNQYKFWFYVRKAIFQGCCPIILAFMTFYDIVKQAADENKGKFYFHIYFYTSLILFLYTQSRVVLEFIFSICSDDIIFKKEIDLTQTTPELILPNGFMNMSDTSTINFIIIIRKIYKLRYSKSLFFRSISKLCWLLGIDGPILIPYEIVCRLTNANIPLTRQNEQQLLYMTLDNLCLYHPTKHYTTSNDNEEPLIPVTLRDPELVPERIPSTFAMPISRSKLDKNITNMQKEFNINNV